MEAQEGRRLKRRVHAVDLSYKDTSRMDLLHRPCAMVLESIYPDHKSYSDGVFSWRRLRGATICLTSKLNTLR
jgi:hypothetical protein